jgi:hypothetical protein
MTDHCWFLFMLALLSLVLVFTVIWLPEPGSTKDQLECPSPRPLRTESMRRLDGRDSPATHSSSPTPPLTSQVPQVTTNGHAISSVL